MALRKQVFQEKVLQKLYPAPPAVEKVLNSPAADSEPSPKEYKRIKLKPHKGNGTDERPVLVKRKVYTVLPPPNDYRPIPGDAGVTTDQPEPFSTVDVEEAATDDCDVPKADDSVVKRRKRRKKRSVPPPPPNASASVDLELCTEVRNKDLGSGSSSSSDLSKNQKRKLKKKRHKEKLLSLGLLQRTTALEFTWRDEGEVEKSKEEENGKEETSQKAMEVAGFLRKTWELYVSDRCSTAGAPDLQHSAPQWLFTPSPEATLPPAAASSLLQLRKLLGRNDVEQLNAELEHFTQTSNLAAEETTAVCALFRYWISKVLPIQMEQKT